MRSNLLPLTIGLALGLSACVKGPNPADPYESFNRQVYRFNNTFDQALLKPVAQVYQAVLPPFVKKGVNNFYSNLMLLPSIANDVLQAERMHFIKDTWRLVINSTIGIGGVLDPATHIGLPLHRNDMGLTFARWGDKQSPYIMIPLLGPSTIRDSMGMVFDYTIFTPYPYIKSDALVWSLIGVRYVDLRADMLETEKLMNDAMDKYSFLRDAYLQNRNYLITGKQADDGGVLYVDDGQSGDSGEDYEEADEATYPQLSSVINAARRTA
jgi:phospholipid-binding lipoprotein MlaA